MKTLWFCWIFAVLSPAILLAQTEPATQNQNVEEQPLPEYEPPQAPVKTPSGVRVFGSLLVVLGMVVLVGYLAKRLLPQSMIAKKNAGYLKVLQNLPMGGGKYVSLIEAEGQKLLIGVTEKQLHLITRLDAFQLDEGDSEEKPKFKTVEELLEGEA